MLRFLSINDIARPIAIFIVLVLIRLPFLLSHHHYMDIELQNLLIGESISSGILQYRNVADYISPLSAISFNIIIFLFGKSFLALRVLSILLIFAQAMIFNYGVLRLRILNTQGFMPAAVYIIIASCNIEFMTLSPVLLSTTFILIAIFKTISIILDKNQKETIYTVGIHLSIAVLFYVPVLVYTLPFMLILVAYSHLRIKAYIIFLYGIFFPLLCVAVFFFWNQSLLAISTDVFLHAYSFAKKSELTAIGIATSFSSIVLIAVLGIKKALFTQVYINFQRRSFASFLATLFGFFLLLILSPILDYSLFFLLVPVAAILVSAIFDFEYVKLKKEIAFLLSAITITAGYIYSLYLIYTN